ncbi:hypothetical protein C0Q70_19405 [Pomacea canaliculata]|uniref:Uncharacterized protein n=1 Tax=Pomacea canaliculata TaxID=400727 RepID=A0A2T7NJ86_POMCA|nr:hypothetical protein C0Q70_19405 [Pomacea canaliculata]
MAKDNRKLPDAGSSVCCDKGHSPLLACTLLEGFLAGPITLGLSDCAGLSLIRFKAVLGSGPPRRRVEEGFTFTQLVTRTELLCSIPLTDIQHTKVRPH